MLSVDDATRVTVPERVAFGEGVTHVRVGEVVSEVEEGEEEETEER